MHTQHPDLIKTIEFLCKDLLITYELIPDPSGILRAITTQPGRNFLFTKPPTIFERGYNKFIRKRKTDLYSLVLKRILRLRGIVREMLGISNERGEVKFVLRVDDFPRWDVASKRFIPFHKILSRYRIPYLLGVTPSICLDPLNPQLREYRPLSDEEIMMLKEMVADGVELALHGFTHQTRTRKKPYSELIGLSGGELEEKIQKGLNELSAICHLPSAIFFVPPFNTVDLKNCAILSKYFQGICTGREAIPYLGFRITPSYLFGTLYIPSYEPPYGRANEILSYLDSISGLEGNIIIPLTLHWSWELDDNFKSVESLAEMISQKTLKWGSLLK